MAKPMLRPRRYAQSATIWLCFVQCTLAEFETPVALTNVKIVTGSGLTIESGTIVIGEGRIVAVGATLEIPADARQLDMAGLIAYPGFIDAHSHLGIADKERIAEERTRLEGVNPDPVEQAETLTREAGRRGIRSDLRGADLYVVDAKASESMRREGFTAALVAPRDGIFSGTSDLIELGDKPLRRSVLAKRVAQHASFTVGEPGEYPRTILGVFAVFRQTLLDARWHAKLLKWHERHPNDGETLASDAGLDALQPILSRSQPVILAANTENEIRRALDLGKEFGLSIIISGGKEAWKLADRIKAERVPLIVSLKFDDEPEYGKKKAAAKDSEKPIQPAESKKTEPVKQTDIYEPLKVRQEKRRLWEELVANALRLHEAGIPFALTTRDFKNAADFTKNLRMVIEKGLPMDAAVAALCVNPAEFSA